MVFSRTPPYKMVSKVFHSKFFTERNVLITFGVLILLYFLVMEVQLYLTLQATKSLIDQPKTNSYSPFRPLSIKLLMTCPSNHFIISTTTEYFDEFTGFSKIFYFITPNMISFSHLVLGFVSAKLVTYESLSTRRLGVLVYEVRMWLDVYDGVVFRSHRGLHMYTSNRQSFGYIIDISCDIVSGIALNFGVLFYLWKYLPGSVSNVYRKGDDDKPLPIRNNKYSQIRAVAEPIYSRNFIFVKALCFGLFMALTSMTWDRSTEKIAKLFEEKLDTTLEGELQSEALHSLSTWFIFCIWKLIEGQAIIQMLLVAIFIDKIWEFFCAIQFMSYAVLFIVNILSELHVSRVTQMITLETP